MNEELLEELRVADEFVEAADEAAEVAHRVWRQRKDELLEAQEALERADEVLEATWRAQTLAGDKRRALLRSEGIVRTADGYALVKTP